MLYLHRISEKDPLFNGFKDKCVASIMIHHIDCLKHFINNSNKNECIIYIKRYIIHT